MFDFKKSVYIGWSMAEVSQIKDCLMQSNIWYKEKLLDHLGERSIDGTVRSHIGTSAISFNNDYRIQYEIFVKSKDEETAKYLIRKLIQNNSI